MEQRKIHLQFKDHRWNLVKDVPTGELMGEAGIDGVSPAVFGKYLAQLSMLPEKNGVRYSKRHTSSGSLVTLERIGDGDGNDGNP